MSGKPPLNTSSLTRSVSGTPQPLNTSYSTASGKVGLNGSTALSSSSSFATMQRSSGGTLSGVSVPASKLPVKHKTLESEAFLADAAANEQKRLIASGRAVPHVQGDLANAHRAPTPAIVRSAETTDVLAASSPSRFNTDRGGAHPQGTSGFGAPSERIAPARLRASPIPSELRSTPGLGSSGAVSAAEMREMLRRPPSAAAKSSSAATVDASGRLPALVDGPAGRTFEDELLEIAAVRFGPEASKRHEHRSDASRGPSVMGFASSSRAGGSDPLAASSSLGRTPSPPLGMSEQYEDTTGSADADDWSNPTTATGKPLHVPYTPDIRAKLSPGAAPHSHVKPKPMALSDYRMLAQACQRAGRARTECHAYYKIAEILADDRETLPKSVPYFKRYLNLCRRLADLQGESKALNALGIVYHRLGGISNLQIALSFHQQHMEIADAAGIFIAQTNRGLIFRALGQAEDAMEALKQALHYAVRAGDRQAEALALANLGLAGTTHGDIATARVCVERQLELNTALQDTAGSCEAYEHLGELAMQRGDATGASELLVMALDLALKAGDQATARRVRCHIGVVQALARTEERMNQVAQGMKAAGKS